MTRGDEGRVPRVTMYSRTQCGLCDEARKVIQAALADARFEFEELFIDGNDVLEREYGLRVPVVLIDGGELFETELDPADFRAAVEQAPRADR